jgi:hypothetical protein
MIGFNFYIPIYELIYRRLRGKNNEYTTQATLVAGGCAGVAGWNTILPWDVIKNRMQVS